VTYIGRLVSAISTTSRLRRPFTAALVGAALAVGGASPALAQDSLPDPNGQKETKSSAKQAAGSDLPTTGIETSWLVLTGMALLATGVAVRPVARRRRSYRTDAWRQAVRSRS